MKKVLIVRLSSMGDIIFHIPLANLFKNQGYQVGWVVSEKGYELIKDNPCVDNVYFVPARKWKQRGWLHPKNFFEFISILKSIRKEKYDIAIDCQRMFKSMYWMLLSGAKRRIISQDTREYAQLGANEVIPKHLTNRDRHVLLNSYEFAKYLGLNTDEVKFTLPETSSDVKKYVDNLLEGIDNTKPLVVIAPATTRDLKHWDRDNWKKLVKGIQEDCTLIYTGVEADRELLSDIGANEHINLCEKTNLESLRELFSRVDLVISPDSGSAHLAWASGKPAVIAIFTCTPPKMYGPFGNDEKYIAINGGLPCQPCWDTKVCPLAGDKNKLCTKLPSADKIINIVKKILKTHTPSE